MNVGRWQISCSATKKKKHRMCHSKSDDHHKTIRAYSAHQKSTPPPFIDRERFAAATSILWRRIESHSNINTPFNPTLDPEAPCWVCISWFDGCRPRPEALRAHFAIVESHRRGCRRRSVVGLDSLPYPPPFTTVNEQEGNCDGLLSRLQRLDVEGRKRKK